MYARRAVWQALVHNTYARNVTVLGDAINSLAQGKTAAQAWSDMQTLIAAAQSTGADYHIVTTLPTDNGADLSQLAPYNALLRANVPTAKLVDFQADTRLGASNAPDGANYATDHVHLSDAGQAIQAQILAASIVAAGSTAPIITSPAMASLEGMFAWRHLRR